MRRSAFTIVEISIFGLLACMLLVAAFELLTSGSKIFDVARRSAGSQVELQGFMETFTKDVESLVYIQSASPVEIGAAGGSYTFAVKSATYEAGLPPATVPEVRKVTYTFKTAGNNLCDIQRAVVKIGQSGRIDDITGPTATRFVARGLSKLKISPFIWVPKDRDKGYLLLPATDGQATKEGAGVACLSVSLTIGEPPSSQEGLKLLPTITTRVWCHNRLLALGWVNSQ